MLSVPSGESILRDCVESIASPHSTCLRRLLVPVPFISSLRIIKIVEEKIQILGRLESQVFLNSIVILNGYIDPLIESLTLLPFVVSRYRSWWKGERSSTGQSLESCL